MIGIRKIRGSRCDRHHSWSWTACTAVHGRLSAPKLFAKSPALSKQVWSEHIYTWKQHSNYNPTQGKWCQFFNPKTFTWFLLFWTLKNDFLQQTLNLKIMPKDLNLWQYFFAIPIYGNLLKVHIGFTLEHVNHVTLLGNLYLQKSTIKNASDKIIHRSVHYIRPCSRE